MSRTQNYAGLTMFLLKIIAILSMLASHISIVFSNDLPQTTLAWMYYFGRLAFPIFAFSVANGWSRTHNKLFYVLRIAIMAILSQIPFAITLKGVTYAGIYKTFISTNLNIGFTFLLSAACLVIYDLLRKIEFPKPVALICAILPALAFEFLTPFHVDYGYRGVALILVMHALMNDKPIMFLSASAVLAWMSASIGVPNITIRADIWIAYLISLILIMLYNGNRGARAKYLFYIFYPLHMIVLYLLKMYVM